MIFKPIATALKAAPEHRAETVAFAVYASYAIITKQLAVIAEDPATPTAVKKAIVRFYEATSPVINEIPTLARRSATRNRAESDRTYDVALSFAGEQRPYVERVARLLESRGVRCYYDDNQKVAMWGKDLYEHLADVFENRAGYVVMFISKEYAQKMWPTHERKSAQARAVREPREYILPARFDDTQLPGLRHTVSYINLGDLEPEQFAEMILKKIGRDAS